jgi:hypothetical protein
VDSVGLGFPKMAESIVYSRLAASDPKMGKFGSKETLDEGSAGGKGSATNEKNQNIVKGRGSRIRETDEAVVLVGVRRSWE